jgi:hypothetical protein
VRARPDQARTGAANAAVRPADRTCTAAGSAVAASSSGGATAPAGACAAGMADAGTAATGAYGRGTRSAGRRPTLRLRRATLALQSLHSPGSESSCSSMSTLPRVRSRVYPTVPLWCTGRASRPSPGGWPSGVLRRGPGEKLTRRARGTTGVQAVAASTLAGAGASTAGVAAATLATELAPGTSPRGICRAGAKAAPSAAVLQFPVENGLAAPGNPGVPGERRSKPVWRCSGCNGRRWAGCGGFDRHCVPFPRGSAG